jgi:hypothetical protein
MPVPRPAFDASLQLISFRSVAAYTVRRSALLHTRASGPLTFPAAKPRIEL